jgi:pyruvate formate lyase activating enzyme
MVLETLEYLKSTDVWFEVTTLLIPGHNDSDGELAAECAWFAEHLGPDVPLHFSAFHPDFKMRDVPRTPPETLSRARRIAREHGLRYVYTGNVHDPGGQSTHCPTCDKPVIVRDWYVIQRYDVTGAGACVHCGMALPGRFDGPVGDWGSRRLPVRLADPMPVGAGRHDRRGAR